MFQSRQTVSGTAILFLFLAACGPAEEQENQENQNADPDQIIEVTENVESDEHWEAGTYVVSGDLWVRSQLTLDPCVTIESDSRIFVESGGSIVAIGTEECPIRFTSKNSNPQPGDWEYMQINDDADNANEFEHVIFEYGGNDNGVVNLRGGASFRNTTVRHTPSDGLNLVDGNVLEFTEIHFEEIAGDPVLIASNDVSVIDGVSAENVQNEVVRISSSPNFTEAGTWNPQALPYQLDGGHFRAQLEIAAGTHILMSPTARVFIEDGGSMQVVGSADEPVIFESANSTKAAGDWRHFRISDTGDASSFTHTVFRHGGGGGHGAMWVHRTTTADNVTFEENEECDVDDADNLDATETDFVACD